MRSERTFPLGTRTVLLEPSAPAVHAGTTEPFMVRAAVLPDPAPPFAESCAPAFVPAASRSMHELVHTDGSRKSLLVLGIAAVLAIAAGVVVGLRLSRLPERTPEPTTKIVAAAVEPTRRPEAIEPDVGAPELEVVPASVGVPELAAPVPEVAAAQPVRESTPVVTPARVPRAKRTTKRRGSYAEVEWSLRKRAATRCKSGRNGFSVEVAFVIDARGDTTSVRPSGPNAASRSAKCVAKLVDAARFDLAAAGRQRLLVTL